MALTSQFGGGVSRRSVVAVTLVMVLVVALFFIPELVQFQKRVTGGGSETQVASIDGDRARLRPMTSIEELSSLLDTKASKKTEGAPMSGVVASAPVQPAEKSTPKVLDNPVTLANPASQKLLAVSHQRALQLVALIDADKIDSRYALYNFINGLQSVMARGADGKMSESDAIAYLSRLRQSVWRAFVKDRVGRDAMMALLKEITLYPLIPANDPNRAPTIPFRPKMFLTDVVVNVDPRGASAFQAIGNVFGRDVERISVYRNGALILQAPLGPPGPDGTRLFFMGHADARGTFVVVASDKYGNTFEKKYRFTDNGKLRYRTFYRGPDPRFDLWFRAG